MRSNEEYDLLMKLIVIGNSGTGKSCILHRFIERKYVEDQTHTIGVEFGAKVVDMLGKKMKLQIWDTAGQERYRAVTRSYYRGAAGCLLVYDITNRESFDALDQWLQDARQLAGQDIVVMLVGNKADLGNQDQRQVTHMEASLFAQEHNIKHFETSAVTGEFVEEAFLVVAKTALELQLAQQGGAAAADGDTDNAPLIHAGGDGKKKKACAC